MRVQGISEHFGQLIATKPTPMLYAAFMPGKGEAKGYSYVPWYTAPKPTVDFMDGFKTSRSLRGGGVNLVWPAMKPSFSVDFAIKEVVVGMGGGLYGGIGVLSRGLVGPQVVTGGEPPTRCDMYGAL
jgi:hypothetical protein